MTPDEWQNRVLSKWTFPEHLLVLAARQTGKSFLAASLALRYAMLQPPSLILLLSPSLRQSKELFQEHIIKIYNRLGRPVPSVQESVLQMTLANGSRIISLPGTEATIRGFSGPSLLIIDEAARVSDDFYRAVRPMLAVSNGMLIALTTPWGKRGWFYEEWTGINDWTRILRTADDCPRITKQFLRREQESLGEPWYSQEYYCHLPSTKVRLADGQTKKMNRLIPGDRLWSTDRQTHQLRSCRITAVRPTGTKPIMAVRTEAGTVFRATPDHQIETSNGKTPLSESKDIHHVFLRNYGNSQDERLARIIAYNLASGSLVIGKNNTSFATWWNKDAEEFHPLELDLRSTGLMRDVRDRIIQPRNTNKGIGWEFQLTGKGVDRLVQLGCTVGEGMGRTLSIPEWILEESKSVRREFLASWFGTRGSAFVLISRKKGIKQGVCSTPSYILSRLLVDSDQFFKDFCGMVSSFGVRNWWRKTPCVDGSYVYDFGTTSSIKDGKMFFDKIGFRYNYTKEVKGFQWGLYYGALLLYSRCYRMRVRKLYAVGKTWSEVGKVIGKDRREAFRIGHVAGVRPSHAFPGFPEWIAERWQDDNSIYLKIFQRKMLPEQEVINIQVDSPDHSYLLADGLDNYNCEFADTVDAVFDQADIDSMLDDSVKPLFL